MLTRDVTSRRIALFGVTAFAPTRLALALHLLRQCPGIVIQGAGERAAVTVSAPHLMQQSPFLASLLQALHAGPEERHLIHERLNETLHRTDMLVDRLIQHEIATLITRPPRKMLSATPGGWTFQLASLTAYQRAIFLSELYQVVRPKESPELVWWDRVGYCLAAGHLWDKAIDDASLAQAAGTTTWFAGYRQAPELHVTGTGLSLGGWLGDIKQVHAVLLQCLACSPRVAIDHKQQRITVQGLPFIPLPGTRSDLHGYCRQLIHAHKDQIVSAKEPLTIDLARIRELENRGHTSGWATAVLLESLLHELEPPEAPRAWTWRRTRVVSAQLSCTHLALSDPTLDGLRRLLERWTAFTGQKAIAVT